MRSAPCVDARNPVWTAIGLADAFVERSAAVERLRVAGGCAVSLGRGRATAPVGRVLSVLHVLQLADVSLPGRRGRRAQIGRRPSTTLTWVSWATFEGAGRRQAGGTPPGSGGALVRQHPRAGHLDVLDAALRHGEPAP